MIKLPILFANALGQNASLLGAVQKTFERFEPWLEQSGMPFFPGFTDHSPRHISDVLQTAASLMSDASHELISPEDVAVLCMAILLHDSGMHLTQDGFRHLISDQTPLVVEGFGDKPWSSLWKEFLSEAQRFGEERLVAVFGDSEPLNVRSIQLTDLSERDCLLIGEFVRRHHARLAHEIAIKGVPSRSSSRLELLGFDDELRDLAGLVARSHGMHIRDSFEYVTQKYGLLPEYRRIKTPYLMAVLRIADYLQVQSERALKSLLSVKELRSPVSRQEWRSHFAVRDISARHDDPEALYVHAVPTDVRTFLKLESLFKDIQRELDDSWAALGEVYGRRDELSKLGITVRRLRSNLEARETFAKSVTYVPVRAGFSSSGPDLLKLLVGPLYNYEHSVGIRELLQNAVDACTEREDLSLDAENFQSKAAPSIEVRFDESDDGTGWITVVDSGVGMSLDTVINYYLIAGASFRNSDMWKRRHLDEAGEARVLRGGRFGVGALAVFLLGEEVYVRTRHCSGIDTDGLEFTARMDEPQVEIRRCTAPAGTMIRVKVSNSAVMEALRPHFPLYTERPAAEIESWSDVDWFTHSTPSVQFRWVGFDRMEKLDGRRRVDATFVPSGPHVPTLDAPDPGWHALDNPSPYRAILWSYPQGREGDGYSLLPPRNAVVNGIRVAKVRHDHLNLSDVELGHGPIFQVSRPSLAIFDPAGVCPLNLQRSAISFDRMGKDADLATAILEKYLFALRGNASWDGTIGAALSLSEASANIDTIRYRAQTAPVAFVREGPFLAAAPCFSQLSVGTLICIDSDELKSERLLEDVLDNGQALIFRRSEAQRGGTQTRLSWFRDTIDLSSLSGWLWAIQNSSIPVLDRSAVVWSLPRSLWNLANEKGRVRQQLLKPISVVHSSKSAVLIGVGASAEVERLRAIVLNARERLGRSVSVSASALTGIQGNKEEPPLLLRTWLRCFNGPLMNFD